MRKKFSVALVALMGLTLFACGKKTDTKPTDTKPSSTDDTTKEVIKQYDVSVVSKIINMPDADVTKAGTINGTGKVEEGKSTTLTATPNTGFTFLGFFANETDTTPLNEAGTYTHTVSNVKAAQTFYAKWQANSYTLTVLNSDDTRGTITYEEKESYLTGEIITLTAEPETGSQFNGWWLSDTECISTDEVFDYVMYGSNTTITGRFGIKQCTIDLVANNKDAAYQLTIYDADEDEAHNFGPDMAATVTFNYNAAYEISAIAADGYTFQGFYLLDENGEYDPENDELLLSPYSDYALDFNTKYIAYFTVNSYTLSVSQNLEDGGDITIEPEAADYEFLSKVTITTTVAEGFTFDGWYSDNTYSDESFITDDLSFEYTLTNAYNTTIYAKYTADGVQFNFEVIGSEEVDGETVYWGTVNESKLYDYDSTLTLVATPTNGHEFDGWYLVTTNELDEEVETLISKYANYDYDINSLETRNIRAKFICGTYYFCGHVNIDEVNEGQDFDQAYNDVLNQTDYQGYVYGSEVTLVAPTVAGYTFVGWYAGEEGFISEDFTDVEFESIDATWTFTFTYYDEPCLTACYKRNLYNIVYSTDGSTGGEVGKKVTYGLDYQLVVPTLTGKNFAGWYYVDTELMQKVFLTDYLGKSITPYHIASAITVQAEWLTAQAIVTFNTDGGSPIDSQTIDYNTKVTRPTDDPEKDGYTFVDWYDSEGNVWSFTANLITENTTIYAHWDINQYELTVESANTTAVTVNDDVNGEYDYHTTIKVIATVKEGYTFAGWYEGTTKVSSNATYDYVLPSRNVTLTAKYTINQYTITVFVSADYADVNVSDITFTGNGTYNYGEKATIETIFPEGDNYHYVGAYRSTITGTNLIIKDEDDNYVTDNPLELDVPARNFSVWIYIRSSYKSLTVGKSTNTGSEGTNPVFTLGTGTYGYSSTSVYADRKVTLHAYDIDGYTFTGWYVRGGSTLISNQKDYQFVMPYENLQYEARYQEKAYSLTLLKVADDNIDDTDDTTTISTRQVNYKASAACQVSTMTGYTFVGWYVSGTDEKVTDNINFSYQMPKQNMTLEARFTINQYQVYITTYMTNTDYSIEPADWNYEDDSTTEYDYNTIITYSATARDGWTFVGYYGIEGLVSFDMTDFDHDAYDLICETTTFEFTVPACNYTIFPMFEAKQYNIVYNPNGGKVAGDIPGKQVLMGASFELHVPTQQGQDFIGWRYTDLDTLDTYYLTDEDGISLEVYNLAKNINVMAIWGTHLQTVTFNTGYNASTYDENDTKTFTQKVEYNTFASEPTVPVRKGYIFDGWYTTEDETGSLWNFETGVIVDDKTLYAHWTVKTYTVKMYHVNTNTGYFTYSVTGTTISGTVAANVSSTSPVSITIEYGAVINLASTFHLGRKINYWAYRKVGTSSNTFYTSAANTTFTCKQDYDIIIVLYSTYTEDMKYYNFSSDMSTCTIGSVSSSYASSASLTVPTYVTTISSGAFQACTSLTSITLPFIGTSKTATGQNRIFAILFGTTSRTGATARDIYYMSGTTRTKGTARYIPDGLKTVTITNETVLPACAFDNMMIKTFNLNEGITKFETYSLANNGAYAGLTIPTTVTRIEDYAMMNMAGNNTTTAALVIPKTVTYIGKGAFADLTYTTITIPFVGAEAGAQGTYRGTFAWFYQDSTLRGTEITQNYADNGTSSQVTAKVYNVKNITIDPVNILNAYPGYGAFMNMTWLTTFSCPRRDTIEPYVFCYCRNLASVNEEFLTALTFSDHCFCDCDGLINIALGTDATGGTRLTFGPYSFWNCSSIKAVTLNHDVASFGEKCFYNCVDLNLTFTKTSTAQIEMGAYAFYYNTNTTSFSTTQPLSEIPAYCFAYNKKLTTFVTGGIIGNIGNYAFRSCQSIQTLNITWKSNANRTVGTYAFSDCTSLATISIPASGNYNITFGQYLFAGDVALRNVTLPHIGEDRSCYNNTTGTLNTSWYWFFETTEVDGMLKSGSFLSKNYYIPYYVKLTLTYIAGGIDSYAFYNTYSGISKVSITGSSYSAWQIYRYAFGYCYLGSFEGNVANIYDGAFYTSSLTSITFGDKLKSIGDYAFYYCSFSSNTIITITDNCTSIGRYAFQKNSGIKSVILGSSVTYIGESAFYQCSTSFSLQFNGTSSVFSSRMSSFATNWNKLSDTLYIRACKCTDVDYSW